MEFLKEWVRNLALLVLLAGCLDLLLPMNGMKKYVRMVMGLLVVLALAKPLLGLIGRPVSLETAFVADGAAQSRLPTMAEIVSQAETFRSKNRNLVLAESQARLAAEAAAAAKAVKGVADAGATVELAEQDGNVLIRQMTVTLRPGSKGSVMKPVQPVQPVRVEAGEPGAPASDTQAAPTQAAAPAAGAEQSLADAVRREVAARLGIQPDVQIIRVLIDGGIKRE